MLRRTVISALAAAAVVLPALPGSALGLTEACAVRNVDTGRNFTSIAAAVSAATRGQELTVRGTCFEDLVLKKSITLRGVPTTLTPRAQISSASGPTILVDGSASVVIRDLELISGGAEFSDSPGALYVDSGTSARLVNVRIESAGGDQAGAISSRGTLELTGTTRVINGIAGVGNGGGVGVLAGTTTISGRARIYGGVAEMGGGAYVADGATLRMTENAVIESSLGTIMGGGVFVDGGGTFSMSGNARVSGSTSAAAGGGIAVSGPVDGSPAGTVSLAGSARVSGNTATTDGGGIHSDGGRVTVGGFAIITGNTAEDDGGGIDADGGVVHVTDDAQVRENTAGSGFGGGIHVLNGVPAVTTLIVDGDAVIEDNEAVVGGGGGIFLDEVPSARIGGSARILGNAGFLGGGVRAIDVVLVVTGTARIAGNSAELGGGVHLGSPGTLNLRQTSVIAANNATTGAGIFVVSGGTVTFANGCAAHVKATNIANPYAGTGGPFVCS